MSDNEDVSQKSKPTKLGIIGLLANNPLALDPNGTQQTVENEENTDSDNEDRRGKMNGLINDFQSSSIKPDDNNQLHRKSITSGHLFDDQSTPNITNPSSNTISQGPRRSISESVLIDHHNTIEQTSTLPIQQDETSTDDDDIDNNQIVSKTISTNNNTNEIIDDSQRSSSATKHNYLDETTHFGTTSSKRSPSISGDEKPVQLPDETGTDTDRDNQEVSNIAERPSSNKSPINRSRSSTPDDSTNIQSERPKSPFIGEQTQASTRITNDDTNILVVNQSSSSNNNPEEEQNQISRSSTSLNNDFSTTNEQKKLIKQGEQLQIPTNDINNSPPPSPTTIKQIPLTNSILETNNQNQSRSSSVMSNEKVIDGDILSSKSRRNSNISQQKQQPITPDEQLNLLSKRRESNASSTKQEPLIPINNKKDSRRSSTDPDGSVRTSAKQKQERILSNNKRQSPLEQHSGQQSKRNSMQTTDQTIITPIKIDSNKSEKNSSITDSDYEQLNTSKLPRVNSSSQKSTTPTNDNQINNKILSPRPQSPNVEQMAAHNQNLTTTTTQTKKKKEKDQSFRRSNSAESFNHIRLVDDKSLDSTSGNNTEAEQKKPRRIKSKKKDVQTNTDSKSNIKIIQRLPKQKSKDSNENREEPVNVNVTVLVKNITDKDNNNNNTTKQLIKSSIDNDRHTQSDTEQIITEKQKKRRRPKRISRTSQTYESVFRRMEREEHEELRPINDTDKNIQTRRSQLRPRTKSPKKHYPLYLSTDAFKIEEILPKTSSQPQRIVSKTPVNIQNTSSQNGKLLILRPTLPFHHTDAVNIQRINLQYSIDLVRNEKKSNILKQSEQTNNLPIIHSSTTPTNKINIRDKSISNRNEPRNYQRKTDGAV